MQKKFMHITVVPRRTPLLVLPPGTVAPTVAHARLADLNLREKIFFLYKVMSFTLIIFFHQIDSVRHVQRPAPEYPLAPGAPQGEGGRGSAWYTAI